MDAAKRKRINRMILVSAITSGIFFVGFWLWSKKTDRDFYLPDGYTGWVRIYYDVPGAPPLEEKNGRQHLYIGKDGVLNTSTSLDFGWRKDTYFWERKPVPEMIPSHIDVEGEYYLWLHAHQYYTRSHLALLDSLATGVDTTLADGTRIYRKEEEEADYIKGRKSIEIFYVAEEPKDIYFVAPEYLYTDELLDFTE